MIRRTQSSWLPLIVVSLITSYDWRWVFELSRLSFVWLGNNLARWTARMADGSWLAENLKTSSEASSRKTLESGGDDDCCCGLRNSS